MTGSTCTRCQDTGFVVDPWGEPIVRPPEDGYPAGRLILCLHQAPPTRYADPPADPCPACGGRGWHPPCRPPAVV